MSKRGKNRAPQPEPEAVDQVDETTAGAADTADTGHAGPDAGEGAAADAGADSASDAAAAPDAGAEPLDPEGNAPDHDAAPAEGVSADADAQTAPADDAADEAGGPGEGSTGGEITDFGGARLEDGAIVETREPAAQPADAETAGEVPGTADAVAGAIDADDDQAEACPVCNVPFQAGDLCAIDVELGICHAACLEGSPTVDLETGDEVDGPIPTFRYGDQAPPPVAVLKAAEFNGDYLRVSLRRGHHFLVAAESLPEQLREPGPARDRMIVSEDQIWWPAFSSGLHLARLRMFYEAEHGIELFPELYWPLDKPLRVPTEEDFRHEPADYEVDGRRKPQNLDANALAALAAASMAFGTTNDDDTALPRMDVAWVGGGDIDGPRGIDVTIKAAAFLRANPTAGPEAVRIELTRKKIARPPAGDRDVLAWRIFAFTLQQLDQLDSDRRAAEDAERRRQGAKPVAIDASEAALIPGATFTR